MSARAMHRATQRWTERRDRREAYCRYLIAQQALRDEIEAEEEHRHSTAEHEAAATHDRDAHAHDAGRHYGYGPSAESAAWQESGAAEMNARLVATEPVLEAIEVFEHFAIAYVKAFKLKAELPGNWERERGKLLQAMRDEASDK